MPGMLGKKIGMTSIYNSDGDHIPVTVIKAEPCKVVSVKTKEKDGYDALQLGMGAKKKKNISKPELGHYKKHKVDAPFKVKEFSGFEKDKFKTGDEIKVDFFEEGEVIKVRGNSKGKGFQGVMKRHNFGGVGGTTHGQSNRLRAPGSIGASSYPSRVFKGKKMAGRKGNDTVTIRNLTVVKILNEENLILVRGAIPGANNSIVELIKN
ncbi:MAG: 50S ribosomal protein L3 [Ignavibacteria bacterium]|nr:50S ribosomal protein L3 [Ignavibacteria bacterium]MBT8383991.1 50S ribosomal protein L3 [Ignavibacteria bacterium]MBT8392054.1 50S ribosomal protein L3 [Ignavibacteria bacterium]NNJ54059.1 50S ribosomal protein L3 [Ignavibacteriaceae bacterium]NNL20981.1 50S ribosomal protein L3 [Ignavibacteriaceae bacterium]